MPRLSNLQLLKNVSLRDLAEVRNRLDPRTYASYERKINATNRKDVAKKFADEIRLIKIKPAPAQRLTTNTIKQQKASNVALQNAIIAPRVLIPAVQTKPARVNVLRNIIQPNLRAVLNKQPKFVKQKIIKIDENNINEFGFWIHAKQIKKMMTQYPTTYIKHTVKFYQDGKEDKTQFISFDFPNSLNYLDIKEKIQYKLFIGGSTGLWIVNKWIYGDLDNEDYIPGRSAIIKTVAFRNIGNTENQARLLQNFRLNINGDCVYCGLLNYFSKYKDTKNIHGKSIYNKLIKNPNKYSKAYTIDEMEKLGQELSLSFKINDLIGKDDIIINRGHNKFCIDFVVTSPLSPLGCIVGS